MSENDPTLFTWMPIHRETAKRLLDYRERQGELIDLLARMEQAGLTALSVRDRDAEGTWYRLTEIDPFTFFSNFNRGVTDSNRRSLWDFMKREWDLESPIPEDFDGIPLANNQNSWFMPYSAKRDSDHVDLLWEFFKHVLEADLETLDIDLMGRCLGKRMVGLAKLTMGMFWVKPETWVSADGKNMEFGKLRGVSIKPKNASEYRDWAQQLVGMAGGDVVRFSHEAHLWAISLPGPGPVGDSGLGHPFDLMFEDLEMANEVFDRFRDTILFLQDGETEKHAVLNTTIPGNSEVRAKRHINLNFGWPALSFNFPSDGKWHVLLPSEFARKLYEQDQSVRPSGKFDGAMAHVFLDFACWDDPKIVEQHRIAMEYLQSKFESQKGSAYNRHHKEALYEAILNPDLRAEFLASGFMSEKSNKSKEPKARPIWLIAPGKSAEHWEAWQQAGIAGIGWNDVGDLAGLEGIEAFREAVASTYPDSGANVVGKMLHDFAVGMEPGDIVIAKKGRSAVLGWGIVSSDYRHDSEGNPFCHVRQVDWKGNRTVEPPSNITLPNKTLTDFTDRPANRKCLDFFKEVCGFSDPIVDPEMNPRAYTRDHALRDLFVEPDKLDRMVSLLRRKKNLVLQGAPGTGKTFIAKRLAWLLMGERVEMVQFHQSTSYEDFIQGFRPNAEGRFELVDGVFHEFCRRAAEDDESVPYVFIIDEINRGNLSKIFGELMLLIEPDKRGEEHALRLAYGNVESEPFHVPENVHLIGTMNTADRSLSLVDYALRRRFAFFEMEPGFGESAFGEVLARRHVSPDVIGRIRRAMGQLNELVSDDPGLGRGHRIGHSFFVPTRNVEDDEAWFREIVEYEIWPLIEEYWIDEEGSREKAKKLFGI
ncbi:MAG TPA: AAA family ATPase [Bacteroidia bacterium]|nr:AAA family ATPase [Bacteroidia bacterium]